MTIEITGKITRDGEVAEFRIAAPTGDVFGYHQWGNTTVEHGRNVDLLTSIVNELNQEQRSGIRSSDTTETVPCVQCQAHGVLSCQETVGRCGTCDAERADINRYRQGAYEQKPESICLDCLSAGHHMVSAHDREHADVESINHLAKRPAGEGGFEPIWKEQNR